LRLTKKIKPEIYPGLTVHRRIVGSFYRMLKLFDLRCLGAFCAFFLDEAHPIAFAKGLEAAALNGGVMDKYVSSVVLLDEPITLTFIEPFDFTFCHVLGSSKVVGVSGFAALFAAVF
jgi:hypothetical protein